MKKIFTKAMTVIGSAALIGATVGAAVAASAYPDPFTSNSAIVYGANAAPTDNAAALTIASNVDSATAGGSMTTLKGASGVTEDEVILGGQIDVAAYKIDSTMTDTDIPSLLDAKIAWDDGEGSDDYDVHEEIFIGDMGIVTTLDDEDLEGVALSNNMGLEYRYVFDDALNVSAIGDSAADTLYLTIMGIEYEIEAISATSITVVTSDEISLAIGESTTVGGQTFTVDDIFDGKAQINGEVISEGDTEKVNGYQVRIDTVGYHTNSPELSKVIVKIGKDITKVYTDGDEYIGQDEDDPLWVWDFSDPTTDGGYIAVKYNVNTNDADDDNAGDTIKYEGAGYILPNNFAEVRLDGLTDVEWEDVDLKFAQTDLYNSSNNAVANENEWVAIITGENTDTISVGAAGVETDELYIWYANNASATEGANAANGAIELFYRDHEGDNTPTNKARFETRVNLTGAGTLARTNIANITVGETVIELDVTVASGATTLAFQNPSGNDIEVDLGGTDIAISGAGTVGEFKQFGVTLDDADALDIQVAGTDVSTRDVGGVMDYYGIIVSDVSGGPESDANSDELHLSVPSDQVYATVSAVAGGDAETTGDAGIMTVKDNAVSTVAGRNLIVVGGSAINTVAAELLGGAYSDAEFTSMTGVGAGEFLIQSFSRGGKTALLVAGYNAADTTKAATYLINEDVSTVVGTKMVGTSATSAELITA
jgi:hypothetical protein